MPPSLRRPCCALALAAIHTIGVPPAASARAPSESPPPSSAPSPYTPAPPTPLEAGGLRPPASAPTTPSESETLRTLQRAEREDAGRGLEFFWVDAEGGFEYVSLQALRSNALLDGRLIPDSGSGLSLGAGAGVRLIFLTLGGRFRLAQLDAWNLWTLDAEVGLHFPFGALEPSVTLAAGYAALGSTDAASAPGLDLTGIEASGLDARLGGSLAYYVNPLLSFGASGTLEVLALWRSGVTVREAPAAAGEAVASLYERGGSGIGLGVTLSADIGLHF